jgi:hypothetical protein
MREERDNFQCLLEYLKLDNAVVNADFQRELQHLLTRNCPSIRLSQITVILSL